MQMSIGDAIGSTSSERGRDAAARAAGPEAGRRPCPCRASPQAAAHLTSGRLPGGDPRKTIRRSWRRITFQRPALPSPTRAPRGSRRRRRAGASRCSTPCTARLARRRRRPPLRPRAAKAPPRGTAASRSSPFERHRPRACPRTGSPRNRTSVLGLARREAVPLRPERRLRAVGDADLPEDARQVRLHRLLADRRAAARSACSAGPRPTISEHLALALGERLGRAPPRRRALSSARAAFGSSGASPRAAASIAFASSSGLGVLEQVAGRAGVERAEDPLAVRERREDDDRDLGLRGLDPARRLDPVERRHLEVHQHDVAAALGAERDGLLAVGRRADELDVRERRRAAARARRGRRRGRRR